MTAISLHAPPSWRAIAEEQVRAVGLLMRVAGALLLVVLLLFGGVAISTALRVRDFNAKHLGHAVANFGFTPEVSIIIAFLALFLPIAMWQDEGPPKRAYHWSMPVARSTHALTKTFAGWIWLLAATAVFVLLISIIDAITKRIAGLSFPPDPNFKAWEWLVPFTAVTIAYLFASAAAVGARSPLIWMAGAIMGYFGVIGILNLLGYPDLARAMMKLFSGFYGANTALGGQIGADNTMGSSIFPSLERWLGATIIWGAAGAGLLYAVSHPWHVARGWHALLRPPG
jgi:hypothetical protein